MTIESPVVDKSISSSEALGVLPGTDHGQELVYVKIHFEGRLSRKPLCAFSH